MANNNGSSGRDSVRPMSRDASKILAEQFTRGLETTSTLLHSLQTDVHSSAVTLEGLKTEVSGMRAEVDSLSKILRDGNGERSVMARLLMLENNIDKVESWMNSDKKEKEIDEKGKWQLKIALTTGTLAFIATIASAILKFLGD